MGEIWKDIKGWEGFYQISNFGNVKSLKRKSSIGRLLKERLLKPTPDTKGYLRVAFHIKSKATHYSVHRLVGLMFLENPLNKEQINHKDGNKENNNVSNLEWCTNKENSDHAYNTGLKDRMIVLKRWNK